MSDPVVIGSGQADEGVEWDNDTADNSVALPHDVRTRELPTERYAVRWHKRGVAYTALRAWLFSRRGRWLPFWLPSWQADMANPQQSGAYLLVDDFDEAESHLAAQIGGVLYPRVIVSAAHLGGGRWQLTLNEPLPLGTIRLAMYLRLVRFAADRIEFRHAAAQATAVAVQCVKVPT